MKDNAFHILNISPSATRGEIADAREDALLDGEIAEDVISKAESALNKPIPRLWHEVTFWWGVSAHEAKRIISDFTSIKDSAYFEELFDKRDMPDIAKANILADFCAQKIPLSDEEIYHVIRIMADAQKGVDMSTVATLINHARAESKAVPSADKDRVDEELSKLRNENHRKSVMAVIRDSVEGVNIAERLAEDYRYDKSAAGRFMRDLICNDYKNWVRGFLPPLEKEIHSAVDALQHSPHNKVAMRIIEIKLTAWDEYVQPIQLMEEGKGFDEQMSLDIFNKLRNLSISLHNDKEESEIALHITKLLSKIFQELPQAAERLEEDVKALEGIIKRAEGRKAADNFKTVFMGIKSDIATLPAKFRSLMQLTNKVIQSSTPAQKGIAVGAIRILIAEFVKHRRSVENITHAISFTKTLKMFAEEHDVSVSIIGQLSDDLTTLNTLQRQAKNQAQNEEEISLHPTIVFIVIIGIIFLIASS